MKNPNLFLLTDRLFIVGLFSLLVNDHIIKYAAPSFLTGKLSDIFGLFIFPFFWSVFFTKHSLRIYILTAVLFVFWKSPASSNIITTINQSLGIQLYRVIDYSDWLALLVLPFSYKHLHRIIDHQPKLHQTIHVPVMISLLCLLTFIATTLPHLSVTKNIPINKRYYCHVPKHEIFKNKLRPVAYSSDSLAANMIDSIFFLEFDHENTRFRTKVKIVQADSNQTIIDFLLLESYLLTGRLFFGFHKESVSKLDSLTTEDYAIIFQSRVIDDLENNKAPRPRIYYENPRLDSLVRIIH